MANVVFMRPFLLVPGLANLIASDADSLADRLYTMQPEQAWQAPDLANPFTFEIELDAAHATIPWDGVWFGAHNHAAGATRLVQRATSSGGLSGATGNDSSGTGSVWPASGRPAATDYPLLVVDQDWRPLDTFYRFPTLAVRSHMRWTAVDTANPNGYLRAGRLAMGPCFQPSRNFGFGWKDVPRNASRAVPGDTGFFDAASGPRWREVHLTMGWLRHAPPTENDWLQLRELLIWANNARDIVVVMNPDADHDRHVKMICGVPINGVEFVQQLVRTFRAELVIRSLG
jgi:hypothetical protein